MQAMQAMPDASYCSISSVTCSGQILTWVVILVSVYISVQIFQVASGGQLRKRSRGNVTLLLGHSATPKGP